MAASCLSERFERRVHTARAFGIESIRHHRITPDEASSGEPVTEVVREFLHWLGGRRLLGYNLGFDLDMLGPARARSWPDSTCRTRRWTWPTRWPRRNVASVRMHRSTSTSSTSPAASACR